MAIGRSCGKFILLGEHFVVHQSSPALAFPLRDLQCTVKISPNHHPHYHASFPGNEDREVIESLMARATYAAADAMRVDITAQALRIDSSANFPISRGFGSSAAFSVALARAFDAYRSALTANADWEELKRAADTVEKIFHGRPSGVDTAVIFSERPIRFEGKAVLREITNQAVDFVVVDSGMRDPCAELIVRVAEMREKNTAQWDRMAKATCDIIDQTEKALASERFEAGAKIVASGIREAQGILVELGLSTPQIDSLIKEAESHGALAGKVSGAGGGGAVVLVARRGEGRRLAEKIGDSGWDVVAYGDMSSGAKNG